MLLRTGPGPLIASVVPIAATFALKHPTALVPALIAFASGLTTVTGCVPIAPAFSSTTETWIPENPRTGARSLKPSDERRTLAA